MKIHISNDSTITEIERARDQRIDPYRNQIITLVEREKIDNDLSNNRFLRKHILEENVLLDTCPHLSYLWFNAVVIYNPFDGFIVILFDAIKKIKNDHGIDAVFFLDLWPILIAIFPTGEIEVHYNTDHTDLAYVFQTLSMGFKEI